MGKILHGTNQLGHFAFGTKEHFRLRLVRGGVGVGVDDDAAATLSRRRKKNITTTPRTRTSCSCSSSSLDGQRTEILRIVSYRFQSFLVPSGRIVVVDREGPEKRRR